VLHEALGDRLEPSPVLRALAEGSRLGRKGGKGFYLYEGDREKGVDESIYDELAPAVPARRGGKTQDSIRTRLVGQMINEAARLLGEGVVDSAAAVDLAMIMGTGFPPFRGGLLRFADSLHSRGVLDRIRTLYERHGDRFAPAPLLLDLARENRGFYDAFGG
jgi:3-hydroxyacyl-CoA dehydrogenase/enoyl-CoA hydratase/3-hydroxybutyryl-CoA epimerase